MLSKKQWQWAADHNQQIRSVSLVALAIGAMVYGGFIWKTLWDKGKTNMPVPFVPDASFSKAYKCKDRIKESYGINDRVGGNPPDPDFHDDASLLLLQRHRTVMFRKEALERYPDCVGALLAGNMEDPNPFVIILYDRVNSRAVYRIEHLN